MIDPFWNPHSICLSSSFWQSVFAWKCCVFNLTTFGWKWYSSFLKRVFVFQKSNLKHKVLKTFENSSNYDIKTWWSLLEKPVLFLLPLKWNLLDKAFYWVKTKTYPNFAVKVGGRSNRWFSVHLMSHLQTSILFNMKQWCV